MLNQVKAKYFGHSIRFGNSRMALRFLKDCRIRIAFSPALSVSMQPNTSPERDCEESQWLEFKTLLGGYLLSSQGDLMALANGVEKSLPVFRS